MGRPTLAAAAFTVAAVLAFLAHEPLLVLLGQRGARARRDDGTRAARMLAWQGATAAGAFLAGLVYAPTVASYSLALPALGAAALGGFIARRREKTTAGEVVASMALSAVGVPVALAAGVPLGAALLAWLVWSATFASGTLAVRAVIRGAKEQRLCLGAALACALIGAVAALVAALADAPLAALAVAPGAAASVTLVFSRASPRKLRRVGWTLVGVSVATLVLLVIAFS